LGRPLEREQVDRLLHDADRGAVAARVEADRADLLLGEVAALVAEPDPLLHVADRVRKRIRLVRRHLQEMERQTLRRAAADPRQARQLRDEIVDGRAKHATTVLTLSGEVEGPAPDDDA